MQILRPPKLKPGDTIGVVAPSGVIEAKGLETGFKLLQKWGFKLKLGNYIFKKVEDYSAGTPQERREDFEKMIKDPEIKAITCAVGGYAASSALLTLSPGVIENLRIRPTLLFGYSDFCLFLNAAFSIGVVGLHAPNVVGLAFHNKESQESLRKALLGEAQLNYDSRFFGKIFIPGKAEGYFLPTNLEALTYLFGSKFDPLKNFDDPIILGLEEVYEDKSSLTRMFEKIVSHQSFNKVKGIILGRFLLAKEIEYPKWGKRFSFSDLVVSLLKDKNIPIVEFPNFGHLEEQRKAFKLLRKKPRPAKNIYKENFFLALPIGIKINLDALTQNPCLTFQNQAVE